MKFKDFKTYKYKVVKRFFLKDYKLYLGKRRNASETGYIVGKQYVDYSSEVLGFEESPTTQILIDKGFIK